MIAQAFELTVISISSILSLFKRFLNRLSALGSWEVERRVR